jgi:hypothetical protein
MDVEQRDDCCGDDCCGDESEAFALAALLIKTRRDREIFRAALKRIAEFDHLPDCDTRCAPVYECSCWWDVTPDQWEIAKTTLKQVSEK